MDAPTIRRGSGMAMLATAAAAVAAAAAAAAVAYATVVPATVILDVKHPPAPAPRDLTAGVAGWPLRPEWVRTVRPAGSHGAAAGTAERSAEAGGSHRRGSGCGGTHGGSGSGGETSTPPPFSRPRGVLVPLTARQVAHAPTGDASANAIGAESRRTPGGRLVNALRRLGRPWAAVTSADGDRRGGDGAGAYGDGLEAFRSVPPVVARNGGTGVAGGSGDSTVDRRRVQSLQSTPWAVSASRGGGKGISRPSVARRSVAAASSGHHNPSGGSRGSGSAEEVAITSPPPPLVTPAPPVAALANWALPASLLITSPTASVGSLPPPPLTAADGGGGWATTGLGRLTAPVETTAAGMKASREVATRGDAEVIAPAVAETEKAAPVIVAPAVAAPAMAAPADAAPAVKVASTTPTVVGAGIKALAAEAEEATAAGGGKQPVQATAEAGAPVAEPAVTMASPTMTAEPPPTASPKKALPESLLITSPTANAGAFPPLTLEAVRGTGGGWVATGVTTRPASSEAAAATATRTRPTGMGAGIEAPVATTIWRDAGGVAGVGAMMAPQQYRFTATTPLGPRQVVVATPYRSLVLQATAADPPAAASAEGTEALEPPPTVTPLSPTPRLPTPVPLPPPMFVRVGSAPPTAATAATAAASAATAAAAVTAENPPNGGPPVLDSAPVTAPTAAADTAAAKGAPLSVPKPLTSLSTAAAAAPAIVVAAKPPPLPLQTLPEAAAVVGAVGGGVPPRATPPLPALAAPSGEPPFATTTVTPAVGLTVAPTVAPPPQTELPSPVTATRVATGERGPAPPSPAVDKNPAAVMGPVPAGMPEALAMPAAAMQASPAEVVTADVTTRPGAAALADGAQARRGLLHRASKRLAAAVAALRTDDDAREVTAGTTAVPGETRVAVMAATN